MDRPQVQVLKRKPKPGRTSPPELPLVRQRRGNDCGPAALATVAAFHGRPLDDHELSAEVALERDGTSLLALGRAAERQGFRAQGFKASYGAIPGVTLPVIAHLRRRLGGGHFVVVYRWTSAHVVVADPALGVRKLSRRTFGRRSTGYFLTVQPAATSRSPTLGGVFPAGDRCDG